MPSVFRQEGRHGSKPDLSNLHLHQFKRLCSAQAITKIKVGSAATVRARTGTFFGLHSLPSITGIGLGMEITQNQTSEPRMLINIGG